MKQIRSRKGMRILQRRTPTGRTAVHYAKQKPKQGGCARCGKRLAGIPRQIPSVFRKLTRSKRRISREYGGTLCAACVKALEKYRTRLEGGVAVKRDLTLEKYLPAGWYQKTVKATGVEALLGREEAVPAAAVETKKRRAPAGADAQAPEAAFEAEEAEKPKTAKKAKKPKAEE